MYSLADAYEKGSGSTVMTIIMGVVACLLFTTGLFLIISTHNSSQSKNLQGALAELKKDLGQSGESSSAALLSLESALAAEEGNKGNVVTAPTFNGLTIKGASLLQGTVTTGSDLTVNGKVSTNGNAHIGGNFYTAGTAEFGSDATADGNLNVTGDTTLQGDLSGSTIETTSDVSIGGNLTVSGDTELNTLETDSDSLVGGNLEVSGGTQLDGGIVGDVEVTGDTQLDQDLTVTGAVETGSFEADGVANLDNGLTVSGLTETDTLTTTSDATIGGDLTVTGNFNSGDQTADSLTTTSDVTDGGDFQVDGDSTLGNVDSQGQLLGSGNLTAYGDLNLGGSINYTLDTAGTVNNISNGNFTTGAWTTTGWSATSTNVSHAIGNVDVLSTNQFAPTVGQTYIVAYTITGTGTSPATLTASLGGQTVANTSFDTGSLNTTIEESITASSTAGLSFTPSLDFDGTISAVYIGTGNFIANTDFTNGVWTSTNWTTTSTTAAHSTGNTSALSTNQFAPTVGQTYQVNYTVSGATSGQNPATGSTLVATLGGKTVPNDDSPFAGGTGNPTNESYIITASSTAGLSFTPSSSFDGVVSNVIIRHIASSNGASANGNDINFNFNPNYCSINYSTANCGNVSTLTIQGAVDVTNPSAPFSYLDVSGDMVAEDNLTVNGTLTADSSPAIIPEIGGDLEVDGTLTIDNQNGETDGIDVTGNGDFGSLSSDADTDVGGNLNVDGTANLNDTNVEGDLGVDGDLTVSGSINAWDSTNTTEKMGQQIDGCNGHLDITEIYNGIVVGVNPGANYGGVTGCENGLDLAEYYPSTQSLTAGEVVSIDTNNSQYVVESSVADDNLAIGIVSTNPGETLGDRTSGYPIALSGRVPVNVTNEGGPIAPGDYLTSSSTPGYAMKAAPGDKTIGQALAGFSGTTGQVVAFVNIVPGNPDQTLQAAQVPSSGDANFTSLNVSGPTTLSSLTVSGAATVGTLTVTGVASVATLAISGHIIGNGDTAGTVVVSAGQTTAQYTFASPYAQVPAVVASPEGQPTSFSVTPTTTGFSINLASPAAADIKFDYLVQQ